jgi:hypothetical protein
MCPADDVDVQFWVGLWKRRLAEDREKDLPTAPTADH